jgi:hypothetical protein
MVEEHKPYTCRGRGSLRCQIDFHDSSEGDVIIKFQQRKLWHWKLWHDVIVFDSGAGNEMLRELPRFVKS